MADKKTELDEINELLAGSDSDLVNPSPVEKKEKTENLGSVSQPSGKDEDKIQDLLAGLDDSFIIGAEKPVSAIKEQAKIEIQPLSQTESIYAIPEEKETTSSKELETQKSSPIEDVEIESLKSDIQPEISDISMDLPSPDEIKLDIPTPSPVSPAPVSTPPVSPAAQEPVTEEPEKPKIQKKDTAKKAGASKEIPEFSEKQLKFIQMRVSHFGKELRDAIREIIVEEKLDKKDISNLLLMILQKKPVQQIRDFVQEKTKKEIKGPLLDEQYASVLKAKKRRAARRLRYQAEKQSGWEIFLDTLLPSLKPLIVVVVLVTIFAFFIYPPVQSSRLIKKGKNLIYSRQEDQIIAAENNFNKALKIMPRYSDAYLIYADAYANNGYFKEAKNKLNEYKNIKGENFKFLLWMGKILKKEGITEGADSALTYFKKALEMRPNNFDALEGIADIHFKAGRLDESLHLYAEFVKKNPKHIKAQFRILENLIEKDDLTGAEQKFREILRLKNKFISPEITTRFAQFYLDKSLKVKENHIIDEYRSRAYNLIKRVLKRNPYFAPAYYQAARYFIMKRNFFSAAKSIERAIKYDKLRVEYYNLKGIIEWKKDEIDKALKSFQEAIDIDPQYLPAHLYLAKLIYETQPQNNSGALEHYQIVYEYYPNASKDQQVEINEEELYYRLGWLYYDTGDTEESIKMWNLFLSKVPDNPNCNFALGTAYLNIGNFQMASKHLEAAVSIYLEKAGTKKMVEPNKPFDKELYSNLSYTYNNLGIADFFLGRQKDSLISFYKAVETIKQIGFFNENEEANININRVLHSSTTPSLVPIERLPRDYNLPE